MGVRLAVAVVVLASCLWPSATALAQVPFADGTYERWSAFFDAPSGALASSGTPLLPEWITVTHAGATAIVTFEPERRVVWRITYAPEGASHKRVLVDGIEVLEARYERDVRGYIARKRVTGPLVPAGLEYQYTTDVGGRVTRRTRTLPDGRVERVEVQWASDGSATVATFVGDVERRADRLDAGGRLLETTWSWESVVYGTSPRQVIRQQHRLLYRRDRAGALTRVLREVRGRRSRATPSARDSRIVAEDLRVVSEGVMDRAEARLLFGSPVTSVDRGRGSQRELSDSYADGCWMNETDIFQYDATGLYTRGSAGCICGFCVEASQRYEAHDVSGTELHWTRGPWLRLDGELVITADHELATPSGPRRADTLHVGDLVTGSDGASFSLRSIEHLDDTERLGRNVETAGGTFTVGRFVVVSEPYPLTCPSP